MSEKPSRTTRWQPKASDDIKWDGEAEADVLRSLCQTSFWFFFQWGFGAQANPKGKKWIDEEVHKPLADWFQSHVQEWLTWRNSGIVRQKHLAVVVHREVGKTTMISQAGQSWLHLLDPEISTYTGSEKLEMASKIVGPIKAVLDGSDTFSLWRQLYGDWCANARTWKAGEVVHAGRKNTARRDPSLGIFGVETSIVGAHPDAIFRDDPISYERLKSDSDWLESVNSQTTSLIPVLQSDGLFVDVGTRYGSMDQFGTQFEPPEEGGDGIASITGIATDAYKVHEKGIWHVYFLAGRDKEGKPTTPKVWPEWRLHNYKNRNPIRYAAQILNDPADSEFNPITRTQLQQCLLPHKEAPWGALIFAVLCDLALWDGRKRINKDESVYIVVGYPRNGSGDVYYIEGEGSMYWRDEDFASRLVALVQRYRRQGRRIMGVSNDKPLAGMAGTWGTVLRNRFSDVNEPCPPLYEFNRGGTHKIQRISQSVNFWVDGHVRVIQDSPGSDRLFSQMEKIGEMQLVAETGKRSRRKDDWVDAFADAFQPPFYQPMRRSPTKGPWLKGATPLGPVRGLDYERFEADDWHDENPRPPIGSRRSDYDY